MTTSLEALAHEVTGAPHSTESALNSGISDASRALEEAHTAAAAVAQGAAPTAAITTAAMCPSASTATNNSDLLRSSINDLAAAALSAARAVPTIRALPRPAPIHLQPQLPLEAPRESVPQVAQTASLPWVAAYS